MSKRPNPVGASQVREDIAKRYDKDAQQAEEMAKMADPDMKVAIGGLARVAKKRRAQADTARRMTGGR